MLRRLVRPFTILLRLIDLLTLLIQLKRMGRRVAARTPDRNGSSRRRQKRGENEEGDYEDEGGSLEEAPPWSMLEEWAERVARTPDSTFMRMVTAERGAVNVGGASRAGGLDDDKNEGQCCCCESVVTYREADAMSDRIANAFLGLLRGYECSGNATSVVPGSRGNDVEVEPEPALINAALLLPPSPFYVACWIGLAKASGGGIGGMSGGDDAPSLGPALINTTLRGGPLASALRTSYGYDVDEGPAGGEEEDGDNGRRRRRRRRPRTMNVLLVGDDPELLGRIQDPDVRVALKELSVRVLVKQSSSAAGAVSAPAATSSSGIEQNYESFDDLLRAAPSAPPPPPPSSQLPPDWSTEFLRIFTSGTTGGKAKASKITHLRFWSAGRLFVTTGHLTRRDAIYCPLPLHHSAGGCLGVSACVLSGASLVVRPKFSASRFGSDLERYRCTVTQYIGELARYALIATPSTEEESAAPYGAASSRKERETEPLLRRRNARRRTSDQQQRSSSSSHSSDVDVDGPYRLDGRKDRARDPVKSGAGSTVMDCWPLGRGRNRPYRGVRLAFGNGMRPEVWVPFQKKFGVQRVIEFYASTEGNTNLVNNCDVVGAVGVVPNIVSFIYPVRLVKCDRTTGDIYRDPKTKLAIPAQTEDAGHLLGLIHRNGGKGGETMDPARRFEGYTDPHETKKKIVSDIASPNDLWFASGDLLRRDWFGFYFFVDRVGDTFRWKGENVSTSEVAEAFFPSSRSNKMGDRRIIVDANIYGVEVPGHPGRAGMARLTLLPGKTVDDLDLSALYCQLAAQLPSYARPCFLRFSVSAEAMGEEANGSESQSHDETLTATFKHKKALLRDQGFCPSDCLGEAIYMRDDSKATFLPLTKSLYDDICSGVRLF